MKLPAASLALVDRRKISDYLLNEGHPDNGGKAAFFRRMGFTADNPEALASALQGVALEGRVVSQVASDHGRKYVVDGAIASPAGAAATVRTIWILDHGETFPRLVTAYPGGD